MNTTRTFANAAAMAATALAAALASTALAQTAWPGWDPPLQPGRSRSPVPAALPADVQVVAPAPGLAADRARWSGSWTGWACADAACATSLAVERVSAEGASFVYVFGSASIKPNPQRVEGRFVGDELHGTLASGSRVAYRFRPDGAIEFLFQPRSGGQVGGVLARP
jgi:hypothetical protein